MTLYAVARWNELFENNRTRELKKLDWILLRNKQDGDGYTELLGHTDGPALFGSWVAILQVASKCTPRGQLIRDNMEPHTAQSLARMTRFPSALMARAMQVLVAVRWLTAVPYEFPAGGCGIPAGECGKPPMKGREGKGIEGNRTEGNEDGPITSAPTSKEGALSDDQWLSKLETQECYAALRVRAEFGKMQSWCEVNRKSPTRKRFINWLNRCERPMAKLKPDDRQRHEVLHAPKLPI